MEPQPTSSFRKTKKQNLVFRFVLSFEPTKRQSGENNGRDSGPRTHNRNPRTQPTLTVTVTVTLTVLGTVFCVLCAETRQQRDRSQMHSNFLKVQHVVGIKYPCEVSTDISKS